MMNREIKFRAFYKDEMCEVSAINWFDDRLQLNETPLGDGIWVNIPEVVLMQWTGVTNKEGMDIYEGDILTNNYVVVLSKENHGRVWGWNLHEGSDLPEAVTYYYGDSVSEGSKVIGNIYENPDLLEGVTGLLTTDELKDELGVTTEEEEEINQNTEELLQEIDYEVNRLEVIDENGRSYVKSEDQKFSIELSQQDNNKTLKVIVKKGKEVDVRKWVEVVEEWLCRNGVLVDCKYLDNHLLISQTPNGFDYDIATNLQDIPLIKYLCRRAVAEELNKLRLEEVECHEPGGSLSLTIDINIVVDSRGEVIPSTFQDDDDAFDFCYVCESQFREFVIICKELNLFEE